MAKVYVTNCSIVSDKDTLVSLFQQVGPMFVPSLYLSLLMTLCAVQCVTHEHHSKSIQQLNNPQHAFAFVEYESEDSARSAVESFNGKEYNGETMRVELARSSRRPMRQWRVPLGVGMGMGMNMGMNPYMRRRAPRANREPAELSKTDVYVGNLSYNVTDEGLANIFAGTNFVGARIIAKFGHSQGYGFVTFANEADQEAAIAKLNGAVVEGRQIKVAAAHVVPPKAEQPADASAAAAATTDAAAEETAAPAEQGAAAETVATA